MRSVRDAFEAGVIVIHQELQLVPELTVAEKTSGSAAFRQGRRHRGTQMSSAW
jgi:ABC-type sugar transport system ATPase subunit